MLRQMCAHGHCPWTRPHWPPPTRGTCDGDSGEVGGSGKTSWRRGATAGAGRDGHKFSKWGNLGLCGDSRGDPVTAGERMFRKAGREGSMGSRCGAMGLSSQLLRSWRLRASLGYTGSSLGYTDSTEKRRRKMLATGQGGQGRALPGAPAARDPRDRGQRPCARPASRKHAYLK